MAYTHTFRWYYTSSSGSLLDDFDATDNAETELTEEIEIAASDVEYALTIDISQVSAFVFVADQVLTIDTNETAVPQETITLAAGVPFFWFDGGYGVIGDFFAGDVTKIFVSNASGVAAQLDIRVLYDPAV